MYPRWGHKIANLNFRNVGNAVDTQIPKEGEVDTEKMSPDLAEIAAAWLELPESIRSAIVCLAEKGDIDRYKALFSFD